MCFAGCPKTQDNVWGHLSDTGMDIADKSIFSDFYNMNLHAWNSINNNINCMLSSSILGHSTLHRDWSLQDSQLWKLQRLCKCLGDISVMFSLEKYFWAGESAYSLKEVPCELNLPVCCIGYRSDLKKWKQRKCTGSPNFFSSPNSCLTNQYLTCAWQDGQNLKFFLKLCGKKLSSIIPHCLFSTDKAKRWGGLLIL